MAGTAPVEIERKFLVDREHFLNHQPSLKGKQITQGYWKPAQLPHFFGLMLTDLRENGSSLTAEGLAVLEEGGPERFEMRVRQKEDHFWVTFKSRDQLSTGGVLEYETPISEPMGGHYLQRTDVSLSKQRYELPLEGGLVLEVDLFDGLHGLAIAEVEIPSLDTPIPALPAWVGKEVTGDPAYFNRTLSERVAQPAVATRLPRPR